MTERGSAVAAGGPAREQAREAVPGETGRDRRAGRREVRPPTEEGGRQPSRCLRACVTAEAEARAEAVPARRCRRSSWQAGHFHATPRSGTKLGLSITPTSVTCNNGR